MTPSRRIRPRRYAAMISDRLRRILTNRTFQRRLANPNFAWLDVAVNTLVDGLLSFITNLK